MSELRDAAQAPPVDPLGLLRAAFEASPSGLLVLAPDGEVLAMNAAFGGIYGLEVGAFVGRHYSAFANDLEVRRHDGVVGPNSWVTPRALEGERVEPVLQTIRNRADGREFVARCGAVPTFEGDRLVATTIAVEDVTEHVRAQRAVEGALSAAEVGTYRVDLQAGRVWADANFARMYGLSEEAARGGPVSGVYDPIHPDDLPRVQAAVREATATGGSHEVEYRVLLPGGGVRWLLSRGRAELDARGEPVQRIGSVMDVTGRRAAEEALRAQTARYEAVIGAERALSEADGDYGTLVARAVEVAQRLTGADGASLEIQEGDEMVYEAACGMAQGFVGLRLPRAGSLSGMTVDAGEPTRCDDAETDARVDRDACARIGLRSMALVPLRYDQRGFGVLKVMAARPSAFSSAETQTLDLLGGFLGAAISRARATRALARSGETFESLVANSPLGIYAVDADFRLAIANPGARRAFASVVPLMGRDFGEVVRGVWPEPLATQILGHFRRVLDTGEPYYDGTTVERRADLNDVEAYDWKVERIAMPDGRLGVVCHFHDVSEAQRRERELGARVEERTEALTRANRDLDQFAYSVAHDLRAPLRNVVSTSRMLLEDAADRLHPEEADLLRRQAASGIRLARIVDDLLGFARLAQAEPKRVPFDLTALAQRVAEQACATRGSSCEVEVREGMAAEGDPSLVGYVLANLLDNALKYSPGGGAVIVGEDQGAFFVRDEGVGFDMAHAHKLFVAFERLVGQEEFEGTGVGLANVRRIVEKHGGRVWAESDPGRGATFWFTLA